MQDVRANISTEKRHQREHPHRGNYSDEGDDPLRYSLPKSTSFHSKDQDVLFESPLYPDSPVRRPSHPYDASSSEYHWNPAAYGQPSTRGEASSSSPKLGVSRQNALRSESPRSGLRRIDTYDSTSSHDSWSSVALTNPMDEDYEEYVVVQDHVKVPGRPKKDWRHPFS